MSHFTGHLTINQNQSFLDATLLIKAGVQDFAQAVFAATAFLAGKGLGTGSLITVTGDIITSPSTAISMVDAVGSGP